MFKRDETLNSYNDFRKDVCRVCGNGCNSNKGIDYCIENWD